MILCQPEQYKNKGFNNKLWKINKNENIKSVFKYQDFFLLNKNTNPPIKPYKISHNVKPKWKLPLNLRTKPRRLLQKTAVNPKNGPYIIPIANNITPLNSNWNRQKPGTFHFKIDKWLIILFIATENANNTATIVIVWVLRFLTCCFWINNPIQHMTTIINKTITFENKYCKPESLKILKLFTFFIDNFKCR